MKLATILNSQYRCGLQFFLTQHILLECPWAWRTSQCLSNHFATYNHEHAFHRPYKWVGFHLKRGLLAQDCISYIFFLLFSFLGKHFRCLKEGCLSQYISLGNLTLKKKKHFKVNSAVQDSRYWQKNMICIKCLIGHLATQFSK